MPNTASVLFSDILSFTMKASVIFLTLLASALVAQAAAPTMQPGKTIYLEKMPEDLDSYVKAEFVKQKVNLVIVADPAGADYVMRGTSTPESKRNWHEGWLTVPPDHTAASAEITDAKTQMLLWAGEAGDRSLIWGNNKRGGQRKVAERLVSNLKKYIAKPPKGR